MKEKKTFFASWSGGKDSSLVYHPFVIDGPIFKRRIKMGGLKRMHVGENGFLNIKEGELE